MRKIAQIFVCFSESQNFIKTISYKSSFCCQVHKTWLLQVHNAIKWLKFHIGITYFSWSIHTFYVWLLAILNPMFILEINIILIKYFILSTYSKSKTCYSRVSNKRASSLLVIFEDNFFVFKELFSENSVLM